MTQTIDQTIEVLVEEGTRKGFLSYGEINGFLEDQFVPPEGMEQIFFALEENGVEVIDDSDSDANVTAPRVKAKKARVAQGRVRRESPAAVLERMVVVERIDDPVRMYLTQMGEIPLLTRPEEIRLAKKIELTRMAFRQKVLESD